MTRDRTPADAHPDDGVLLALHDRESVESPEALQHIGSCHDCQARLERIRLDSALVRSALRAVPVPAFDVASLRRTLAERGPIPVVKFRGWRRPAIQAAAALALATAAAASVGPIRSLIARRKATAVTTPPRQTPMTRTTPRAGATVSFAEAGPIFTVRFDSTPAAGDLEIDRGTGPEVVSAQAITLGADSADAMVVLPHELRLRNDAGSRASYRIMIPGSVEQVRVIVGGRALFDSPPRHARIALASGRRE